MFFRKSSPIGIDIGSNYIKIAQINEIKGGYELGLFDMQPMLPGIVSEGLIADKETLIQLVRDLLKKSGIRGGHAIVGVAGHSSVIIKRIAMPLMTEDELCVSIRYEAEQYIPFDINDVNMDFQILGPKRDEEGQMEILLVAVKKNVIDDYVEVVTKSGLAPVVIDVNAFALSNIYEINYDIHEVRNVALVNVGAHSINITVLEEGTPLFTRDSPVGSNQHTEALERAFEISAEDAERLKMGQEVEGISAEDAQMVIKNASDEVCAEIYRSFEYFKSSVSEEEVTEIVLSGGAALMAEFPELIADRLRIPVKVFDPFRKIAISEKLDAELIREVAPIGAVAAGLALRRAGDR